ncbi:MAG: glycosyltransferase [Crocinitomicaceae bacterium]
MREPAIVVIAYNRAEPLKRLLKSLSNAHYPSDNITLHISIDASDDPSVKETADEFDWKYGKKIIDVKTENQGLLKHVMECGQLTDTYGSIIVLEDDLIVAPGFYTYAIHSNEFYSKDDQIAGVSLFTYPVEENNFYPFQPIQDDSDVHFIQVASSWGQSWNVDQWSTFKNWLTNNPQGKDNLPEYIVEWGSNSWKRLFISYLIDTDRYFVFPNTSYSSNFEEEGTHASNTGLFQVPLNLGNSEPRLKQLNDSNSVYDVYFELLPKCVKNLSPSLSRYQFDVDFFGKKPLNAHAEFVLTSKRSSNSERSFGSNMKPLIQNVIHEIEGDDIVLCRKEDLGPTEKDRFLLLNSSSAHLDQLTQTRRQKLEQVTLVLPVLDDQLRQFTSTLNGLTRDRFYDATLMIVCSSNIESAIKELINGAPLNIRLIISKHQKLDDLLRVGIEKCSTDYCTWLQPGMQINLKRIEEVSRIFQGMDQVQILHGIQDEVDENNHAQINTLQGRWTPIRANANTSEVGKIRTEFVFWRTRLVTDNVISRMKSTTIFLELLKLNPVYLVVQKLGSFGGAHSSESVSEQEVSEVFSAQEFQPKGGIYGLLRPIFQFWFSRNVPFFRLFYKEGKQLPLVIRYDFKNDSYYLNDN